MEGSRLGWLEEVESGGAGGDGVRGMLGEGRELRLDSRFCGRGFLEQKVRGEDVLAD